MFDVKLGYDPASPENIEQYAIQLKEKTFMDVVLDGVSGLLQQRELESV